MPSILADIFKDPHGNLIGKLTPNRTRYTIALGEILWMVRLDAVAYLYRSLVGKVNTRHNGGDQFLDSRSDTHTMTELR